MFANLNKFAEVNCEFFELKNNPDRSISDLKIEFLKLSGLFYLCFYLFY
jgi:hypothetical protein